MENKKVKDFIERLKRKQSGEGSGTEEPKPASLSAEEKQDAVLQNYREHLQKKRVELREERERVCFPIVNRGQVWYDTLTNKQRSELTDWYRAWLNVTKTLKVPPMPEWLK